MNRQRGQGSLELIVAIPCIIAAALLAWQLAAVGAAARDAEERVRIEALRSTGSDDVITLTTSVAVDGPLASGLAARARARVVAP